MNKSEKHFHDQDDLPNIDDEEFWNGFEESLGKLFTKSAQPLKNNNFNDCLSFGRSKQIAENPDSKKELEINHLSKCRNCLWRVKGFEKILQEQLVTTVAMEVQPPIDSDIENKGIVDRLREIIRNYSYQSPGWVTAAVFLIVCLIGSVIYLFNRSWKNQETVTKSPQSQTKIVQNDNNQNNAVSPDESNYQVKKDPEKVQDKTADPPFYPESKSLPGVKPENDLEGVSPTNPAIRRKNPKSSVDFADNTRKYRGNRPVKNPKRLNALTSNDAELVSKLEISDDVELLTRVDETRDPINQSPSPITLQSPLNKAVITAQPIFSWQTNEKMSEFIITIENTSFEEIVRSGRFQGNIWQIDKNLTDGFYFWHVSAINEKGIQVTSNRGFFKIVSEKKKRELARLEKKSRSSITIATAYFQAGLFDEAEKVLQAELVQNPRSESAKKLLDQIQKIRVGKN